MCMWSICAHVTAGGYRQTDTDDEWVDDRYTSLCAYMYTCLLHIELWPLSAQPVLCIPVCVWYSRHWLPMTWSCLFYLSVVNSFYQHSREDIVRGYLSSRCIYNHLDFEWTHPYLLRKDLYSTCRVPGVMPVAGTGPRKGQHIFYLGRHQGGRTCPSTAV